jgi:two-component system, NarL family, nitrate/nitrite response regulator NarL
MTDRGEEADGPAPEAPAPTRVMLVDDHPLVRAAVRQAITADDIEVVGEAGTGEEARELAAALRPDLLLVDIDLPGISGLQLLRELRHDLPDAQVMMLTVSGAHRDLIEAVRLGAAGYLTKDVSPEALLRSVRAARAGDLPIPRQLAATVIADLADPPPDRGSGGLDQLTDRELEVLRLISDGRTDREAAAALSISTRTVEAHVGRILRKVSARNRAEAARLYRDLPPPSENETPRRP